MPHVSAQAIDSYIESEWEHYLADLARLVSIDSTLDKATAAEGAPFGAGPRAALDEILGIAARIGLEPHDGEGYAGFADLPAQLAAANADATPPRAQTVGVIGHVDVVPPGQGWTFSPFALTRKEGMLLGRGTTDDKGPLLCALYALKFWIDAGVSLRHNVRFIFGCNEETGMEEVPYFLKHYGAPDFLFTPDAEFPLCYGEKGLFGVTLSKTIAAGSIESFEGGSATNAVPACASAVIYADAALLPCAQRIEVESLGPNKARIVAQGVSGHASMPEGTVNAIAVLAKYLLDARVGSKEERAWLEVVAHMAATTDGSAAEVAAQDDDFGALTSVVGIAGKEDTRWNFTVDIRFPTATSGSALVCAFEKVAKRAGATLEVTRNQEPFIVNPHTEAVQALLQAYNEATGKQAKPFTMGGATYAREFPHAVSFGPAEEGACEKPAWVGGMHGADEGTSEEELKRALGIYIRAFGNLAEVQEIGA